MADMKSRNNLDKWRTYFRNCDHNIFDIIENGIMVAAADFPQEFKSRRERIAETLFTCKLIIKCVGNCDDVELSVPSDQERKVEQGCNDCGGGEHLGSGNKDCKVDSGGSDDQNGKMNGNQIEHHDNDRDVESLSDAIKDESQIVDEVLRIKEIINNSKNEAGSLVLESLQRLESMHMSVEMLQTTEVGKAVNALRKHASADVRNLARTLIKVWKVLVDKWITAEAVTTGGVVEGDTPESLNPSGVGEDKGLPSPPLENLAPLATHNTSMELSQFVDSLEDNSNPRNREEFMKKTENGRDLRVEGDNTPKQRQQAESVAPKCKKEELTKNEEAWVKKEATILKPNKPPSILKSRAGRSAKPSLDNKALAETRLQPNSTSQRPPLPHQNKGKCSNENAVQVKLETTKRKLQESYLQAENAKRQRTVQVMELHDLPKRGLGHKNPHLKPSNNGSNHNRQQPNNRS